MENRLITAAAGGTITKKENRMPTIKDAERVFHLNNERYLLRHTDVGNLKVTIKDQNGLEFPIKHVQLQLLAALANEIDLQVAAIDAEIRSLGFDLEPAPAVRLVEPTAPPAPAAVMAAIKSMDPGEQEQTLAALKKLAGETDQESAPAPEPIGTMQ